MKQITITSINSAVQKRADVLSKSGKHIRVALAETTIIIDLHRTDLRRPYIGRLSGLDFEYDPKGKND